MPDFANESQQSIIVRQLEKLDERTRVMPTKDDINEIKRTMATRDYLDGVIKTQDYRLTALENEVNDLKKEQLTRSDKAWLRLTQLASIAAVLGVIFDFLRNVKVFP